MHLIIIIVQQFCTDCGNCILPVLSGYHVRFEDKKFLWG